MDRFTPEDLRRLVEADQDPLVSIYMPTYRSGREVQQNSIRFKNLVDRAAEQLKQRGASAQQVKSLLDGPSQRTQDDDWWQHQSDGLAIFLAPGQEDHFRLPLDFAESVTVGSRFKVRPLVPLLQGDGTFYILAASQNRVRLLTGTRFSVDELDPDELPRDLRSALNIDEYTSSLQHHSAGFANEAGSNIFHGHGGSDMDVRKKDELLRFFQQVSNAVESFLENERVPLVFAGVDYLFPLFREASHYQRLVEEPVTGNPDRLSAKQLHEQAWNQVAALFAGEQQEALRKYHDGAGGDRATTELADVVRGARQGAVDTLFLASGEERWGVVDEQKDAVAMTEGPDDESVELLNYAAVHTLLSGGRVYSLPSDRVPNGQPIAAVLRFPLPR